MYNVGSLATNKQRLASTYDTSPWVALARELAGITGPGALLVDHSIRPPQQ